MSFCLILHQTVHIKISVYSIIQLEQLEYNSNH